MNLAQTLYHTNKEPILGVRTTLHFWERYVERYNCDLDVLSQLLKHIDKNICLIIFNAASNDRYKALVKISGVKVPVALMKDAEKYFIQLRSIY